jgi:hypothetical protein
MVVEWLNHVDVGGFAIFTAICLDLDSHFSRGIVDHHVQAPVVHLNGHWDGAGDPKVDLTPPDHNLQRYHHLKQFFGVDPITKSSGFDHWAAQNPSKSTVVHRVSCGIWYKPRIYPLLSP